MIDDRDDSRRGPANHPSGRWWPGTARAGRTAHRDRGARTPARTVGTPSTVPAPDQRRGGRPRRRDETNDDLRDDRRAGEGIGRMAWGGGGSTATGREGGRRAR